MSTLKIKLKSLKPRNPMAKEVLSVKYRMRVVSNKIKYNRKQDKSHLKKELSYGIKTK